MTNAMPLRRHIPGTWTVVDDFAAPAVEEQLRPFLGPSDVARFRFTNTTVEFRKGKEPDAIEVQLK